MAAFTACYGTATAQCDMILDGTRNVEYPYELRTTSGKLPLALGRNANYYYLHITIPADSAALVTSTGRTVLTRAVPQGLALEPGQMRQLAEHPLDTLVLYSPMGRTAMPPKDDKVRSTLRAVANCALNAPVPAIGTAVPNGASAPARRPPGEHPGTLLQAGGRHIALGAGITVIGGAGALLAYSLSDNKQSGTVPGIIGGVCALTGVILTIDGGSRIARAGGLMRVRDY